MSHKNLIILDYSDKSFVVGGDTIPHSQALGTLGGSYSTSLRIGPAWIFSNKRRESVEKYIETGKIKPYIYTDRDYSIIEYRNIIKEMITEIIGAFDKEEIYDKDSILTAIELIEKKYTKNIPKNIIGPLFKRIRRDFRLNKIEEYTGEKISNILSQDIKKYLT